MLPHLFCLVASTDDLALLPALAEAGVDGFQVRDKVATTRELVELTRVVIASVEPYGACVVVDDRLDVALATGAHGVHLGPSDLPVAAARRLAPELLVGATCRDRAMVAHAAHDGADYAGIGPIFHTMSKTGAPDPLGLGAITSATGILPLIGIGGIDAERAAGVRAAGGHGVAVIAGLWRQPDPIEAAKGLVAAVA